MAEVRAELARRIAAHVRAPGEQATPIPGLTLYRLTAPTACYPASYESGIAVFAQGRKRVTIGRATFVCDESTFLLTSVEVPLVSEIVAASKNVPLLALFLRLDMAIVREILDREEFKTCNGQSPLRAAPVGQSTPDLLQSFVRLVDLLDAPGDMLFLGNLIHREIVYRLLQYPQGNRLRAMAKLDEHGHGTSRAITLVESELHETSPDR